MHLLSQRLMLAASAAIVIAACAKKTEEAATTETAAVEPMAEADDDPNQIGTANVEIGLQNNAPYFTQASEGFCNPGSSCQGGIVLNTGDIDLSGFPPGDVLITVTLNNDAIVAGYSFPSDFYQAIGIAITPPGGPQFGQQYWPSGFLAPVVADDGHSVSFTDLESDQSTYEYSIGLNGPNGRVVMDPEIKNGGGHPPEPVPPQ